MSHCRHNKHPMLQLDHTMQHDRVFPLHVLCVFAWCGCTAVNEPRLEVCPLQLISSAGDSIQHCFVAVAQSVSLDCTLHAAIIRNCTI